MTGAVPLWRNASDADLAVAAASGDRMALAGIYDRYADRLYDFCVRTVGDRDAAADCVQDVFCIAATGLSGLREPDKLRPWLYSIARHQAMRRLRNHYREQASDEIPDAESHDAGPDTLVGRSELAELVAAAAGGLSDRDRELLELTYRHGLDGPELADALGVTLTNANTMAFRLRKTIERSLGALLVARSARNNRHACPELAAVLGDWDGQFTILMRKRIARHIESCVGCAREQQRRVNPVALLGGAPLFIPAPDRLRDQTFRRVQLTSASTAIHHVAPQRSEIAATVAYANDVQADPRGRPVLPLAALVIGIPLSCLGLTMAWVRPFDAAVTTATVGGTELGSPGRVPTVATAKSTGAPSPPMSTSPPARVTTPRTTASTAPAPSSTTSPTRRTTTAPTTDTTTPYTTPTTQTTDTTTPQTTTPQTTTPQTATPQTTTPQTTTPWSTTDVTSPTTSFPTPSTMNPRTTPAPLPTPEPAPIPTPTTSPVPAGPVIH